MTGTGSGAPGRVDTLTAAPMRAAAGQLAAILVAGLIFRLTIAYLLPGSGFANDLAAFMSWAQNLAAEGPFGFYERPFFHDYTPGYLYVLWLVGVVGGALGGIGDLIKLPAILSDLALGWLAWRMVLDLGASRRRANIAALIVVVNPITWFDSVVWGQVDSFGVVFLLLAIRELWKGRTERAAILAVAAALIKPQLGILVPIVTAVTFRRALSGDEGWGDEAPQEPTGTAWERRTRGPVRILTTGVAGFLAAVVISAPFGLWVVSPTAAFPFLESPLAQQIAMTAGGYEYVTVNAYNIWALLQVGGNGLAANGTWINDVPVAGELHAAFLGIPAVILGTIGLLVAVGLTFVAVFRRPDRLTILVAVAVMAIAFFAVPTRVHERYSFPFFGVAAILAAVSMRWCMAYLSAAIATFANMYVVLTTLYDNPQVDDWLGIGESIRSPLGVTIVAVLHTVVLAWCLLQLRDGGRRRLADELLDASLEADGLDVPDDDQQPVPREPRALPPHADPALASSGVIGASLAATPGATSGLTASPPAAGRRVPAWFDRPSLSLLGPVAWLRARMAETPLRPDRSRALHGEGRGRLDRLDLWIVLVLVVASLFLRTFRLAEPARMHFDEVYHARTAAEFLQDWRYDLDHNIYEWTHPHLAKYAMALGIVAFAGHDVEATGGLGVPVRDADIEPRRPDPLSGSGSQGDRLWIATGSELVAFDLETRARSASWSVPGAAAVRVDTDATAPRVLVATDAGDILALDLAEVEALGVNASIGTLPVPVAALGGSIRALVVFDGGGSAAALLPGHTVVTVDLATGEEAGRTVLAGANDLADAGRGNALVATLADIVDPAAVAAELATLLGGDEATYRAALEETGRDSVTVAGTVADTDREAIDAAIGDGRLAGISVEQRGWIAVSTADGVTFLGPEAFTLADVVIDGGAGGLTLVSGVSDGTQLWTTSTDQVTGNPTLSIVNVTGDKAKNRPSLETSIRLPGAGMRVSYDPAAGLVQVLGAAPDGAGTVMYVVDPHGRSVFADHKLPFVPAAWALDTNSQYPVADRTAMLAFDADGTMASMDVGHYAFAWRLPGVIAGALTLLVLYLLARTLFARRAVAVFVGLFVLLDGMFFVQSRIAMNDVYVGLFILTAYLLFARLWLDPGRPRWAFWAVMPAIGVLLGLALASKWVAAYAIGALGILILTRSALGRVILIIGLIGLTAVLGWMAMSVPVNQPEAQGNLVFVIVMLGLTLGAVMLAVYRPIGWHEDELRFAVGAPLVLGVLVAVMLLVLGKASDPITFGPFAERGIPYLAVPAVLLGGGVAIAAAFFLVGRAGFGPLAPGGMGRPAGAGISAPLSQGDADDGTVAASAPAEGWFRLGSGGWLPVVWMLGSLLAIPLVVYVISYLPWAYIDNHQLWEGFPAGNTGQTLAKLTGEMYNYHNGLTAAHAASSPWLAWPLNMKPVWFYQGGFANSTSAAIYDAGNLVIWWVGIPALAFAAFQAYRRRSLALALIVIGFLCQWVAWARIDRAAFQYHYYTSLPFVVLALGYFIGELWHGASRATWWLARGAAAVALMGPVIFWLMRAPLCLFVGVNRANPDSQACTGNPGNLEVNAPTAAIAIVTVVTGLVLIRMLVELTRDREDGSPASPRDLLPLVATAVVGGLSLALARLLPADRILLSVPGLIPELIALVIAVPLGLVALQVLTARDGRRFVAGFLVATGAWFLILYPNIAALPLPSNITSAYQGLLPSYIYAFQFPVNEIPRGTTSFGNPQFVLFAAALVLTSVAVGYAAWVWRSALTERLPGGSGDEPPAGDAPADEGPTGSVQPA